MNDTHAAIDTVKAKLAAIAEYVEEAQKVLGEVSTPQVGALVRLTVRYGEDGPAFGLVGIVRVALGDSIGVEWVNFDRGHWLDGALPRDSRRGWYVPPTHVEVLL